MASEAFTQQLLNVECLALDIDHLEMPLEHADGPACKDNPCVLRSVHLEGVRMESLLQGVPAWM